MTMYVRPVDLPGVKTKCLGEPLYREPKLRSQNTSLSLLYHRAIKAAPSEHQSTIHASRLTFLLRLGNSR